MLSIIPSLESYAIVKCEEGNGGIQTEASNSNSNRIIHQYPNYINIKGIEP